MGFRDWLAELVLRTAERKQAEAEAAMRAGDVLMAERLLAASRRLSRREAALRPTAAEAIEAIRRQNQATRRQFKATQRRLDALKAKQSLPPPREGGDGPGDQIGQ